ncbi:MAG TPA: bifunctional 4-hydroxy-2-oxoglutarate aldolase/2-dehydro-3-deoxy-phosphogluconate aldolase [Clostridiales bacterium]|nr:bifunctional 4-hydroxy-2-oxoglutarate aldolase/2-dehydro-3-deoxy-phosphogluconate aldolase [Clostridiales bacterium]
MNSILEQIGKVGLVPVIKIKDPQKAVPLAKSLKKGGVPVAEVTFRTEAAAKAIENIATTLPDIILGAGTVLSVEQAKTAVAAGAKYIITPGFDEKVVGYCVEHGIPVTPGCSNASEVTKAVGFGLEVVKFFPAEALGGIKVLKALAGPFPNIKYIPTGGIGPHNLLDYISINKVLACGGSWMVPDNLVESEDWEGITRLARQAVISMLAPEVSQIQISETEQNNVLATLMSELINKPFANAEGQNLVTISVTSIERLENFLILLGLKTIKQDSSIRLADSLSGFNIRFTNKN